MIQFLMSWLTEQKFGRFLMGGTYVRVIFNLGLPRWYEVAVIAVDEAGLRTMKFVGEENTNTFTEDASFIEAIETYA